MNGTIYKVIYALGDKATVNMMVGAATKAFQNGRCTDHGRNDAGGNFANRYKAGHLPVIRHEPLSTGSRRRALHPEHSDA